MLRGREFTEIVDDTASRASRVANMGGEKLTEAGFSGVKISVVVTVETKDKTNGSCKMVREASYSDYDSNGSVSQTSSTGSSVTAKNNSFDNGSSSPKGIGW